MSKHKSLVNPDHYKLRGRDPQAGNVLQDLNRQRYAEARAREKRETRPAPQPPAAQPEDEEAAAERPPAAARPQAEEAAAEPRSGRVSESAVREKRNDPRDAQQDLGIEDEAGEGRHTSAKTGKQSSAKKMESTRHNAAPIPATSPVPGAFGRRGEEEPPEEEPPGEGE